MDAACSLHRIVGSSSASLRALKFQLEKLHKEKVTDLARGPPKGRATDENKVGAKFQNGNKAKSSTTQAAGG